MNRLEAQLATFQKGFERRARDASQLYANTRSGATLNILDFAKLSGCLPMPEPDDPDWVAIPDPWGEVIDEYGLLYRVELRDKPGKKKRDVNYTSFICIAAVKAAVQTEYFNNEMGPFLKAQMDDVFLKEFDHSRSTLDAEEYQRRLDLLENSKLYDDLETYIADGKESGSIYRPLPHGEGAIRLLVLLPAKEKESDLKCILCTASLSKKPEYEALSYTWGDPSETTPIFVGDQVFQATKSLTSALRHLRYKDRKKVRVLWVDAICINQSNTQEKNPQVQLMSQIYSMASKVIVWLGPESNTSRTAIEFMIEMVQFHNQVDYNSTAHSAGFMKDKLASSENALALESLKRFLSRPWFQRAWIVQEIVLAKAATVYCGPLNFDWEYLAQFSMVVSRDLAFWNWDFNERGSVAKTTAIQAVGAMLASLSCMPITWWRYQIRNSRPLNLAQVVNGLRHQTSSDPRDKVYSTLGFVSASEQGHPLLQVNYDLPMSEVYMRTAQYIISKHQNLDLFSAKSLAPDLSALDTAVILPSWVPDLRLEDEIPSLIGLTLEAGDEEGAEPLFAAGGRPSPEPYLFSADGRILTVNGICFDEVIYTGEIQLVTDYSHTAIQSWCTYIEGKEASQYITGCNLAEAFWRTVLSDNFLSTSSKGAKRIRIKDEIPNVSAFPPRNKEEQEKMRVVALAFGSAGIIWKRFIVTKKGYIGMAPANTRIGDIVSILLGGATPFTLRKYDSFYRLIGETYIHGIMDGEALEMQKEGLLALENIQIA